MSTAVASDIKPPLSLQPGYDSGHEIDESHLQDEEVEEELEGNEEWDEGGPSHCGYSEGIHDTLMSVGKGVHSVVGAPSENVESNVLKRIGIWFQEMSYTVRDMIRGDKQVTDDISITASHMKEDAQAAVFGEDKKEDI